LGEPDIILSDHQIDTVIGLYEGKGYWYFEIWRYDQDYECIVPKVVPRDIAIYMVLAKELKEDIEFMETNCETDYDICMDQCINDYDDCKKLYGDEEELCKEEYDKCMNECQDDLDKCMDNVRSTELYANWEKAREDLSKRRIAFLGCYDGDEVGHPDIDEICVFRLP